MAWRIRITGLRSTQNLAALAQLLVKLPGMDVERIRIGLSKPPLELPLLPDPALAQRLQSALVKLGANLVSEEVEEPKARPSPSIPPTPRPYRRPESPAAPIELRPIQLPVVAKVTWREWLDENRRMIPFLALVVLLPFFAWLLRDFLPQASGSHRAIGVVIKDSKPERSPSAKAVNPEVAKAQEVSRRQNDWAESQMQKAATETDKRRAAALLEEALKFNPWSEVGWDHLQTLARDLSEDAMMERAKEGLRKATQGRLSLEKSLRQQIPGGSLKVSVSRISITGVDASPETQQKLQPFLLEAGRTHPTKSVVLYPAKGLEVILR